MRCFQRPQILDTGTVKAYFWSSFGQVAQNLDPFPKFKWCLLSHLTFPIRLPYTLMSSIQMFTPLRLACRVLLIDSFVAVGYKLETNVLAP